MLFMAVVEAYGDPKCWQSATWKTLSSMALAKAIVQVLWKGIVGRSGVDENRLDSPP